MAHLSASSPVNVKYAPEIESPGLAVLYVVLGDNIVLDCPYSANPRTRARATWYKNGERLRLLAMRVRNNTLDHSQITISKGE